MIIQIKKIVDFLALKRFTNDEALFFIPEKKGYTLFFARNGNIAMGFITNEDIINLYGNQEEFKNKLLIGAIEANVGK